LTSALEGVEPQPHFTPGKNPISIVQGAEWAPGSIWTGAEKLAPAGIRSPDRPARSKSLYHLSYPAHKYNDIHDINMSCNVFNNNNTKALYKDDRRVYAGSVIGYVTHVLRNAFVH
jgi:hypothetical protein